RGKGLFGRVEDVEHGQIVVAAVEVESLVEPAGVVDGRAGKASAEGCLPAICLVDQADAAAGAAIIELKKVGRKGSPNSALIEARIVVAVHDLGNSVDVGFVFGQGCAVVEDQFVEVAMEGAIAGPAGV